MLEILVIEDGYEYITAAKRLLAEDYSWTRAEGGHDALTKLQENKFDAIVLDMDFDRVPHTILMGDLPPLIQRFEGDEGRALRFLQRNQGNYILAALREKGCELPVLLSYDFDDEPRRWNHLVKVYGPIDYLPDNHGPKDLKLCLLRLVEASRN